MDIPNVFLYTRPRPVGKGVEVERETSLQACTYTYAEHG